MRFPLSMMVDLALHIARNKMRPRPEWQHDPAAETGDSNPFRIVHSSSTGPRPPHPMIHKRFPLVLMLEPLHACNLTCTGCGRIREYQSTITQRLSVEQCLDAVDECGAPIVSISGGEPLLYPEMDRLVREILSRNRYIYLCTNGLLLRKRLGQYRPHRRLFLSIHLDGMEKTHDAAVEREGVFREAVEGIKAAKKAGFRVYTNTTIYQETDMEEIAALFQYLGRFGVDGHMLSPGFAYGAVNDREIFLTREDVHRKFKNIDELARRFPLNTTPVYQDFLQGKRELPCTAWANPTYNIQGWRSPCYLIADTHYKTFEELMSRTPWDSYGRGADERCEHCMVHCGFEPSAALGVNAKFSDNFRLLTWALR